MEKLLDKIQNILIEKRNRSRDDIWISITPKNKNIAIGYDSLKTNTTGTGMSIYGMKISLSSFYGEIDGIFNGLNEK